MNKYNNLVQMDLTGIERYSYSKLSSFDTCPLMYYKTYVKGDRGENNSYALAGSIAHNIIDEYYHGKYLDFELLDVFNERWQTEFLDNGYKVMLILPKFKKDLTQNYYNSFIKYFSNFKAYDDYKIIGTEIEFMLLLDNGNKKIIYNGIIDGLSIDENGEYILWDSKSKSAFKNQQELDNYLVQLYTYSIYVKYKYNKFPKYLKFNQFRLEESKRVTTEIFDINKYNEAVEWIFNTVEKIENEKMWLPTCEEFFANNLCSHRSMCESNVYRSE